MIRRKACQDLRDLASVLQELADLKKKETINLSRANAFEWAMRVREIAAEFEP